MCGIFAQIRRSSSFQPPDLDEVSRLLEDLVQQLSRHSDIQSLGKATELAQEACALLSGLAGFTALARNPKIAAQISKKLSQAESKIGEIPPELESVKLLDAIWSLRHDRLEVATKALSLHCAENYQARDGLKADVAQQADVLSKRMWPNRPMWPNRWMWPSRWMWPNRWI